MNDWTTEPMRDLQAFLTKEQIDRLIQAAAESGGRRKERDVLLLSMLTYTGRRIGEILRVQVKDILLEERKINYNILKKKRPTRKIKPVNENIFNMLLDYIEKRHMSDDQYIFRSTWNNLKPISDARVRQIVYKYSRKANLPDFAPGKHVHPHTFRHSFAIASAKNLKNPGDLRKLQMALEHSKIDITTHYLQYSDEEQREIVDNVYKKEEKQES